MSNNDTNNNNNNDSRPPSQIGRDMWREIASHLDLRDVAMLSQANNETHGALHDHPGLVRARKAHKQKKAVEGLRLAKLKDNYTRVLGDTFIMSDSELSYHAGRLAAAHIQGNFKEVDAVHVFLIKNFKPRS